MGALDAHKICLFFVVVVPYPTHIPVGYFSVVAIVVCLFYRQGLTVASKLLQQ